MCRGKELLCLLHPCQDGFFSWSARDGRSTISSMATSAVGGPSGGSAAHCCEGVNPDGAGGSTERLERFLEKEIRKIRGLQATLKAARRTIEECQAFIQPSWRLERSHCWLPGRTPTHPGKISELVAELD